MSSPTWSDLNSDSIIPPMGARKGAGSLGPVALMVSCRPDFDLIKKQLTRPRVIPFFNNTLMTEGDGDKGICIAGPYMGAPYAAMLLESLITQGVKKIVVLGWCGAVGDELNTGDIVLVTRAIVDEGTSVNYKDLDPDLPCSEPDSDLSRDLMRYITADHQSVVSNVSEQIIWTTDAIYRETPKKVAHFKKLGAKAVEMECSALFSVAHFRKVDIAALLVVSDSVASKQWQPGFRKKAFKQARTRACDMALQYVRKINEPQHQGESLTL